MNPLDAYFAAQEIEAKVHSTLRPWAEWEKYYTWEHVGEVGPGAVLYRGFSTIDGPGLNRPTEFRDVDRWWDEPFRYVWISGELRMVLSYTEGDLHLVKCVDREAYKAEIRRCGEFYKHLVDPDTGV